MKIKSFLVAAVVALSGCGSESPPQPQAIPVETLIVEAQAVPNIVELPGRVESIRTAEVRARVTGIVQSRLYEEGTDVREGQPLFRIDPAELRASYNQTEAALQRARATAANARAVVERYRPLVDENAISRQEYDAALAASREAAANVAQIQAQLQSASLQLGYTTVRAPISGRASSAQVTEGALVSQAEGTLMTRIEQVSPVYVTFSQSVSELQTIRRRIASGELDFADGEQIEVYLTLPDGTEYGVPGLVDFLDFSVDAETGTVALRARFANPDRLLQPGEFVRGRFRVGDVNNAIAVPQSVVNIGETGGSVLLVSPDDTVMARPVELGEMVDGKWIVTSGLEPGDEIITNNLQKLRPGMPVAPTPKNAPAPRPATPAPAATRTDAAGERGGAAATARPRSQAE
ncbi:efflux RND transporter periplasmic adaptor subunit [uncultured Croceicoccus sp.]|uniref:efflux RND transporter periplasmic adaptor subunit n=1 Tax=uncultured Croceicoccus sp. TaxID=1295329 RepID=UPI00261DEA41|nr:efflux RND transporter periplasmic adaptor subunit [uncultured Croceicoccus sp.]